MNILLVFPGFIIMFVIVLYYEHKIRNLSIKPKNNLHFYVARDMNGELWLYIGKPFRRNDIFCSSIGDRYFAITSHNFNSFGLNENDYDNLTWKDDPVEVFLNIKN